MVVACIAWGGCVKTFTRYNFVASPPSGDAAYQTTIFKRYIRGVNTSFSQA